LARGEEEDEGKKEGGESYRDTPPGRDHPRPRGEAGGRPSAFRRHGLDREGGRPDHQALAGPPGHAPSEEHTLQSAPVPRAEILDEDLSPPHQEAEVFPGGGPVFEVEIGPLRPSEDPRPRPEIDASLGSISRDSKTQPLHRLTPSRGPERSARRGPERRPGG